MGGALPRSCRDGRASRWRIAGGSLEAANGSAAVRPRRLRWCMRSSGSLVRLSPRNTLGSVMLLPAWDCLAGRCCPYPLEPGDGGYCGMPTSHPGQAAEPTNSALDCDGRPQGWPSTATAPAATAAAAHQSWWARNPPPGGDERGRGDHRQGDRERARVAQQPGVAWVEGGLLGTRAAQIPKVTRPWATRNRPTSVRSMLTASLSSGGPYPAGCGRRRVPAAAAPRPPAARWPARTRTAGAPGRP
jgi:hypothetical protein